MTGASGVIESLQAAARRLDETRTEVEDLGEEELHTVAEALQNVEQILNQYESRATDRDDLKGYIEFREAFSDTLDEIPADIRHNEAFIEANKILTTGLTSSLSTGDFEQARKALEPVREDVRLLESWHAAQREYQSARHAVKQQKDEVDARIDELEEIVALGEADLDAPTDKLSQPIEAYNEAITTAYGQYLQETPAREVLSLLATAESYPLVELPTPPQRLESYLETADVGSEPVSRLVELASFSRSKLEHYVDDPQAFSAAVGPNRAFLSQLSDEASSLKISWPPDPARELKWRARELVSVTGRFTDESVVEQARTVYRLASTNEDEFNHLRETAVARERLTDEQRTRLKSGAVDNKLETLRAESRRLDESLEQYEPRS
ncbi:hypothetical protein [Haloferax sp. DFSO60]|uniref:DUF7118 family protein n=1 Tax=Haloferax sp. DFSO60 TaxID=3388652 RepID=UPI00397D38B5